MTSVSETPEKPKVDLSHASVLSKVIETSFDGVVIIDDEGMILSFSPTAEAIFGYKASEIIGMNVSLLIAPPHRQQHDKYLSNYKVTEKHNIIGTEREELAQRKDGSLFPIELKVGEVKLSKTRIFTGFIKDLSDRKENERRIAELQEELVHVARYSAMGELAGALSHELNQPLAAINNYARASQKVLEKDPVKGLEKALELMGKAGDQAERAGEIIWRIRRFIKHHEVSRSIEEPCVAIMEAVEIGTLGIASKNIELDLQCPAKGIIPSIPMDRIQIQQVVTNFVRNAVDALEDWDGKRLITMNLTSVQDEKGEYVRFCVRDSGAGLRENIRSRLFEPFNTHKDEGVGIGLAVSKTIIDGHKGFISGENHPDGGAIFCFELPVQVDDMES